MKVFFQFRVLFKTLSRGYMCNLLLEIAMQFEEIISLCSMSYNATSSETLQKNWKLLIFLQFFCGQILQAHRVASLQLFPSNGNVIISEKCIAVVGEKLPF